MFDVEYKNYKIHIRQKDDALDRELVVVIKNKELELAFSFTRKCNETITHYTTKSYSLFGNTITDEKTFKEYSMNETLQELIIEARAIVDMLCKMEDKITMKVETESSRIIASTCSTFLPEGYTSK